MPWGGPTPFSLGSRSSSALCLWIRRKLSAPAPAPAPACLLPSSPPGWPCPHPLKLESKPPKCSHLYVALVLVICHGNRTTTQTELGTRDWDPAVAGLAILIIGKLGTTLGRCSRKVVEQHEQGQGAIPRSILPARPNFLLLGRQEC